MFFKGKWGCGSACLCSDLSSEWGGGANPPLHHTPGWQDRKKSTVAVVEASAETKWNRDSLKVNCAHFDVGNFPIHSQVFFAFSINFAFRIFWVDPGWNWQSRGSLTHKAILLRFKITAWEKCAVVQITYFRILSWLLIDAEMLPHDGCAKRRLCCSSVIEGKISLRYVFE